MKADIVIIGGGLASLIAGIKLQQEGKSVIIISAGQSALHFSSGSMGLLGKQNGDNVDHPLQCIDSLHIEHPYRKLGGVNEVKKYLVLAQSILEAAGIELKGSMEKNHYKFTPYGLFTPEWLTLTDHLTVEDPEQLPSKRFSLIGIKGFLDFFPLYLQNGLKKLGAECNINEINIREFDLLRQNPTEMRAPNIARILDNDAIKRFADEINKCVGDEEVAIIPAVVGLNDNNPVKLLRQMVKCPLFSVATTPNSVPGIRMQIQLRQYFKKCGGWYLLGDQVTDGIFKDDHHIKSLNTVNLGQDALKADHYILATGSFFSKGLRSTQDKIIEPIFDLDIDYKTNREEWYDKNIFKSQPFMRFGVKTDEKFHCCKNGKSIYNLSAIGSILGGSDPLSEGSGAGIAMSTSLHVTENIIKG